MTFTRSFECPSSVERYVSLLDDICIQLEILSCALSLAVIKYGVHVRGFWKTVAKNFTSSVG